MRRFAALAVLGALATACEDGGPPRDTLEPPDAGCPDGLDATTSSTLALGTLNVDGATLFADYDPSEEYDEGNAGCVATDGDDAFFVFEVAGQAYGSLRVASTATGGWSIDESSPASFTLDLFGASVPSTWSSGTSDWQTGTINVTSIDPLDVQITGTGIQSGEGGHTLSIDIYANSGS